VPEIAINKHSNLPITEYEVGATRQIRDVGLPGKPGFGEQLGKFALRARALPFYAGHHPTPHLGGHYVAAVPTAAFVWNLSAEPAFPNDSFLSF
jgi:hypothetical protein